MLLGELQGELARFGKVARGGTDSEGQPYFKATCPTHQDRQPSLSVTAGQKRVRLHCFAGCDEDAILAELGRDRQSLFYEPARRPDGGVSVTRRPAAAPVARSGINGTAKPSTARQRPAGRPARSYRSFTFPGLGAPVATYRYHAADGSPAYVVGRYRQADGDKTFRQFTADPASEGAWFRRGPRDEDKLLYGLPELRAAIDRGDRIVLVEGEKDADNGNSVQLDGVRFTTAAGGANAAWQQQYTEQLAGASSVIVVADNDQPDKKGRRPGLDYAAGIVRELRAAGLAVTVAQAATGKDWTDHAEAGGSLDDLVPTELPDDLAGSDDAGEGTPPGGADGEDQGDDDGGGRRRFLSGPRYAIEQGRIWRCRMKTDEQTGEITREFTPVLGCVVEIVAVTTTVTGDTDLDELAGGQVSAFKLRATHPETDEVLELTVDAKQWRDGAWLDSLWPSIPFRSDRSGRNECVQAVRQLSPKARRAEVYGSTGWITLNGERAYVHAGGAITSTGTVELDTDMPRAVAAMRLPDPPSVREAIDAASGESLGLLELDWLPKRIGFVLAGAAYRSILPANALVALLVAPPGSAKTALSIISAQHFAPELSQHHKVFVSMSDLGATAKAAQAIAHRAADAMLIVDDYPPQLGRDARPAASQSAFIRAAYDRSKRDSLTHDRRFVPGPGPRCVVLTSAEYAPTDDGARGRALEVPMPWGTEPPILAIADAQKRARADQRAAYMAFLIQQAARKPADELAEWTASTEAAYAVTLREAGHAERTAENVAKVMTGWAWATACMVDAGLWSSDERAWYLSDMVWPAALDAAEANADPDADRTPVDRLVRLIGDAIGSRVHVADRDRPDSPPDGLNEIGCGWTPVMIGQTLDHRPTGDRIGWVDGDRLYLDPGPALTAAMRSAEAEGTQLPAHSTSAAAQLLAGTDRGLRIDKGRHTRQVRIAGRQQRVWDLPLALFFDGDTDGGGAMRPGPREPQRPTSPASPLLPSSPITPPEDTGTAPHPAELPEDAAADTSTLGGDIPPEDAAVPPAARSGPRWRAAEALITPGLAILPDGTELELPNGHAGDLARWAVEAGIGHDADRGRGKPRTEPGHLWLSPEFLAQQGLPATIADPEKMGRALAKARAEAPFWRDAEAAGFEFGKGRSESGWVRLWRSGTDDQPRGSAVITSAEWVGLYGFGDYDDTGHQTASARDIPPRQLIRRLGLWTHAVGRPVVINEGLTFRAMGQLPGLALPSLPWAEMSSDFMWQRPLTDAEQAAGWVHCYDRRKSYLAACATAEVGADLVHVASPEPDPRRAGFWRVTRSAWAEHGYALPDPQLDYDNTLCEWVASPILAVLMEHGPVEVAEAWLYEGRTTRVMEPAYRRVRDALALVEHWKPSTDTEAVIAGLKASYRVGIGLMAQLKDLGEVKWGHRPDVRATIIATHRANSLRAMLAAGERGSWPIAMARSDSVLFVSDEPDAAAAWPGRSDGMADKLGKYKTPPRATQTMTEWRRLTAGEWSPSRAIFAVTDPDRAEQLLLADED